MNKTASTHPSRHALLLLLLALILLAAFALRIYRIDAQDIWGDEAISVWLAKQPLAEVAAPGAETNPPLYHVLLRLWAPLAGRSVFAMRYMSALPGLLAAALTYAAARRVAGRKTALIAMLLAASSSFAIYYSQEARMYGWTLCLATLSVYSFLRLYAAAQGPAGHLETGWLIAYGASTLAAMYTHYYAVFVLVAQNVFVLVQWRPLRRWIGPWLALQAALVIAYIPWNVAQARVLLQSQVAAKGAGLRAEAWGIRALLDVWGRAFTAFGAGTTLRGSQATLALTPLIGAALGAVVLIRERRQHGGALAFWPLLYLLVPMAGVWAVGPFMPFFWERYLLLILPAYMILLAAGIAWLADRGTQWRVLAIGAAAGVIALNLVSARQYYGDPAFVRGRYGEMMATIEAQAESGDVLLLDNGQQWALYDYYGPDGIPASWFPPPGGWGDTRLEAQLREIADTHRRAWLVMFGNPAEYDAGYVLENWLSRNGFRAYFEGFQDARLSMYVMGDLDPDVPIGPALFGDSIYLTAYGISSTSLAPGDTLQVALAWEAAGPSALDYTIFTHLIDSNEQIAAQFDGQPQGGTRPTSGWQAGETFIDRFALRIPPETAPGIYRLQVGWYDWITLDRLPVTGPGGEALGERVILSEIEIKAP